MKFIRLGKRAVNMDMVQEVELIPAIGKNQECYRLYFNQTIDGLPNYLELEGVDMIIAFEFWLRENSEDLYAPMMSED